MESGEPTAVLDAEGPLATAVSALRGVDLRTIRQHPNARAALLDVRLGVARCRTLGHASGQMLSVLTSGDPVVGAYGRSGRPLSAGRRAAAAARS
jgi:hypothetical protein